MRLNLLMGVISAFFILGCATTQNLPDPEVARLKNRMEVLESELKQTQDENLILKEKIVNFQKAPLRMPTGRDIQIALKRAGFYKGEIDGQIGEKTKEAIKKFQTANGLNPDGAVGSRTWSILTKYLEEKKE
jgi:murein L,D-transpeptidase YcbB/YkuD